MLQRIMLKAEHNNVTEDKLKAEHNSVTEDNAEG